MWQQCVPWQYCLLWISLPEELKPRFMKLICWRGSTADNKNSSSLITSFGGVSQSAAGVLQVHKWRICVFTLTDKSDMTKWTTVKDAPSHTLHVAKYHIRPHFVTSHTRLNVSSVRGTYFICLLVTQRYNLKKGRPLFSVLQSLLCHSLLFS